MTDNFGTAGERRPRFCSWQQEYTGNGFSVPYPNLGFSELDPPICYDRLYWYEWSLAERAFAKSVDGLSMEPPVYDDLPLLFNEPTYIAQKLTDAVSNYLSHVASAIADLARDLQLGPTDAFNMFDERTAKLIEETREQKWIAQLERLNLPEDESGRYEVFAIGVVPNIRQRLQESFADDISEHIEKGGLAGHKQEQLQRVESVTAVSRQDLRRRVGENIRRLRNDTKLSQAKLAELVGLGAKQVLKHEKGKQMPEDKALSWYAEAFTKILNREVTAEDLKA